jgi:ABC-type glycerol-3-phosphate transport system permease component
VDLAYSLLDPRAEAMALNSAWKRSSICRAFSGDVMMKASFRNADGLILALRASGWLSGVASSIVQGAGLLNTLPGLTVAYVVFALPPAIYILYSFYSRLPDELLETARIDGASEPDILFRVILPLFKPALISVGVYSFMRAWNDLLNLLTLVTQDNLRTIGPGLLLNFFGGMQQDWGGARAAAILA